MKNYNDIHAPVSSTPFGPDSYRAGFALAYTPGNAFWVSPKRHPGLFILNPDGIPGGKQSKKIKGHKRASVQIATDGLFPKFWMLLLPYKDD